MKKLMIILSVIFITPTIAQTKLFVHPDAKEYVKNTRILAILPLRVQVKAIERFYIRTNSTNEYK